MSLSKPSASPLFATDPTFASGSEIGLSPRLDPGAGVRAQGILPESRIAGRWLNYMLGGHGDLLVYADLLQQHAALAQWSAIAIPVIGTDQYRGVVGMRSQRAYGSLNPGDLQREVIVFGIDSGTGNRIRIAHTADGSWPENTPARLDSISGFTNGVYAVAGAPGEIGLINNGATFAWTTDSTQTWNLSAGFTGPPSVYALHYDAALGYFAITNNTTNCFKGSTFANLSATPTTSVIATPGSSAFAADEVEVSSNGSVLLVAATTASGVSQVYRSADAGATWATVLSPNVAARHINVTFNEFWSVFVAWADTGEVFTSPDGLAWGLKSSGRTPANGFLAGRGTLVSAGGAIAKTTKSSSAHGDLGGVVYSLDLGATWNYRYFADLANIGTTIQGLRGINGRIYATALGRLWRSGPLTAPNPEI